MSTAVYVDSFDPVTLGHTNIIKKASQMFDKVVVGILVNKSKTPKFSMRLRYYMINEAIQEYGLDNVQVDIFEGLLIDFARKHNTNIIIRGLRNESDFKSEFPMAKINEKLDPDIITSFLKSDDEYECISSSMIKELKSFNVNISQFLPRSVNRLYDFVDDKKIIGLMGRSGSGKSTISKLLEQDGYITIDCDKIGHVILNDNDSRARQKVIYTFSDFENVYDKITDSINRKALAKVVFNNRNHLEKLNSIMFPEISKIVIEQIYSSKNKKFVIDAFGIDKTPIKHCCDKLIACLAYMDECARRIMARDNISEMEAVARLANQPDNEYYKKVTNGNVIDISKIHDVKLEDLKEMFSI